MTCMYFSGKTNVGMKRQVNQDRFAWLRIGANAFLFVVCDGMGGANAGHVASSLACKTFTENIKAELEKDMGDDEKCILTPEKAEVLLIKSVQLANQIVYSESFKDSELNGMGTTLVGALIVDDTAYVVNVGDSRGYLIFGDIIDRITHDHSYVQFLVDIGQLSEEEARSNANKNIIMKAVGISERIEPDTFRVEFGARAFLLLCSDGLTNFVEEEVIKKTVLSFDYEKKISLQEDVERVCDELIALANENGGADNITAALYLHEKSETFS